MAQVAVCEIDNCGVLAVGRCATCGRAFCASHQAIYRELGQTYVNLCAPCFAKTPEQIARAKENAHKSEESAARNYLTWDGTAHSALREKGILTVDLYQFTGAFQSKSFGRSSRIVKPMGRGWLIGELKWGIHWTVSSGYRDGDTSHYKESNFLTALIDCTPGPATLTRVRPYLEGYEALDTSSLGFLDWIEAVRSIKRILSEA